ncbi:MAG TPA: transposase [Paenibacillus sp.]|uniref:transposase n=1 Tax=Paenibacillus sp. TaxID=58172 RepID=UPI0028D3D5A1|nr:transposase [Paenibacillus sp.]HUC93787.1 transposase [Paenibacillus sp.]
MDDSQKHKEMEPMSGEPVEVDGIYKNEWGGEVELKRGDVFPADPMLGTTEWELVEFRFDNHHTGKTDPRLVPKADQGSKTGSFIATPLQHTKNQEDA